MPKPAPGQHGDGSPPSLGGGVTNKIGRAMRTTRAGKVIVTCIGSMGKSCRIIAPVTGHYRRIAVRIPYHCLRRTAFRTV